jgi:uncharacterized protein YyaL (SSP411 family)
MPNRLADAHSPYLLQHAANPVDWWPWCDEAFAEAERRGVPVFLSIGYATCHWCHVMEHESFEHPVAARALNDAFVCIKVDREERPDVDGLYMEACLALNGHGGWPLTAVLTPEREPFYVATYLPRESRGGRIGVIDLASSVTRFWQENPEGVRRSAAELTAALRTHEPAADAPALGAADVQRAADALRARFDPAHAGFGAAPKFPTPHHALFLLRRWRRSGEPDLLDMATRTLRAIRHGGVWDHLGGGLHRYSTDAAWLLPHFEKMLYDQALYAMACTDAHLATGDADLREAAESTLDYVLRDLTGPHGAFFTAEDADSLDVHGRREEGAFYVWTEAELLEALGPEDAALARALYGTSAEGNYTDEATRQRTGANVLHHPEPPERLLDALGIAPDDPRLVAIRQRLLLRRAARPRPLLDDKVLLDWNGLAIAALARAARAFGRTDYADAATRAAAFLAETLRAPDGWMHRYHDGHVGIAALLDDLAFLAWGLTDLYQTTFEARWLSLALDLHAETVRRFGDPRGGYFVSPDGAADLIARRRDLHDGALPSGNSAAVYNGVRLARLTGRADFAERARLDLRAAEVARTHPSGFTFLLGAADLEAGSAREIVVVGEREAPATQALLAAVLPHTSADDALLLREPAPYGLVGGRPAVYVCRDQTCEAPLTSADDVRLALTQRVPAQEA